jgi:hypothetical protein
MSAPPRRQTSSSSKDKVKKTRAQQIADLQKKIKELKRRLGLNLAEAVLQGFVAFNINPAIMFAQYAGVQAAWGSFLVASERELTTLLQQENEEASRRASADLRGSRGSGGGSQPPAITGERLRDVSSDELIKNVGLVTEAYLSSLPSFATAFNLGSNNRPTNIKTAEDLWRTSSGHKGLIQRFVPRGSVSNFSFNNVLPIEVKDSVQKRWGFQFHYNPGSVLMEYAGIPNVSQGYIMSGEDVFNAVGTQVSQSTIQFQLVLNRVFDMQYYTKKGRLREDAPPSVYSPAMPTEEDQKEIYNKGTMYDVEFLLSTILGYRINTFLRKETADIGWIGGNQVEIYLGNSLKYLAVTTSATVQHTIFNERMVPTFSTLSLVFNRIPDYANGNGGVTSGPTGINQNTAAAPPPPAAKTGKTA